MVEIKAREGYYLSDPNKEHFYTAISGADVSADDYIEVPVEEAEEIMRRREVEARITTVEALDNVALAAEAIPEIINTFELSDDEALKRKDLYPEWASFIGKSLDTGFKVLYEGRLYKVRQPITTVLEDQYPSENTAALYEEINETAAGTLDDPIPYNGNMELFEGLYYSQAGVTYKCTRSTGQAVYHDLSALVGIYVQKIA